MGSLGQSTTTISLVRHGEVENPQAIYYGRLPHFPLSAVGERQAQTTGRFLADAEVTAVYHSPLLRTTQTAALIAQASTPPPPCHITEELIEVYTPYDGLSLAELEARHFDLYTASPSPYEQPRDILARSQRFIQMARQRHPGQHVVAVTHGDVIAFTLLWAMGHEPLVALKRDFRQHGLPDAYPAPASVMTLVWNTAERPTYRYVRP